MTSTTCILRYRTHQLTIQSHRVSEPEVFTEKTDIELRVAVLATGASGAAVAGGFDIVLVDKV